MDKSKQFRLRAVLIVIILAIGISNNMIAQDVHINQNTTWTTNQNPTGNVIVENGATLTINQGVTVTMQINRYIEVQQECKLIATGATFTTSCTSWFGMFTNGYGNSYDQLYFKNPNGEHQPEIILTNCIIEKMQYGINNADGFIGNPNITSGGLLKIIGCTFNDCQMGVRFYHYTHVRQPNDMIARDLSYVYNSSFNDLGYFPSPVGVFMREVIWINIHGCTFTSVNGQLTGVQSNLASFSIDDYYTNQPFNPVFVSASSFTNCRFGVRINAANGAHGKVLIRNTSFTNNRYGILGFYADNIEVYSNTMTIQQDATPIKKVGIYLEHSTTFYLENNNITALGYNGTFPTKTWGIVAHNCGENNNRFYRNTVNNCEYNIVGQEHNRGKDNQTGLQFICNNLYQTNPVGTDNTYYMACLTTQPHNPLFGINDWQAGGAFNASTNQFEPNSAAHNVIPNRVLPSGSKYDFYNEHVRLPLDIFYRDPQFNTLPLEQLDESNTVNNHYGDYIYVMDEYLSISNQCPSTVPSNFPTPTDLSNLNSQLQAVKFPYGPLKSTFAAYENNGDHQFMLDQVNGMDNTNYTIVYYYLLNNHPSTDVIAIAVGNDVLPSYMCSDVLTTNSYGIKSQLVRDALASRQNQLSSAQMALINTAAQSQSQYESYLLELASLRTQINTLSTEKYNYYFDVFDDEIDINEVINTLTDNQNYYSYLNLMMYYFENGNNQFAEENYSNAINAEEVSDLETTYLDRLFPILWSVYEDYGGDFSQLTQEQIDALDELSNSNTKSAGISKSILEMEFGYDFEPILLVATQNGARIANDGNKINSNPVGTMKIIPNPADNYIGITLSDDFEYPIQFRIYDLNGRLILEKQIENINTIMIDHINSGFYQAELEDANHKLFTQKLIIK